MKLNVVFSILVSLVVHCTVLGQEIASFDGRNKIDLGFSTGVQISGIKSEDFIGSNVAPVFNFRIEDKISPDWSLQIGFEGFYFNTIENTDKRHYSYFYGAVKNKIFESPRKGIDFKSNIYLTVGSGLFVNHYYSRPNICATGSLVMGRTLVNRMELTLIIKSIVGWDIYQGNEDILNSVSFGLNIPIRHLTTHLR